MASNETIVGWTPESGGRGTWSTIWPCLSTMFLALWVSYHPMAPGSAKKFNRIRGRILTVSSFILVPEAIFIIALDELFGSIAFKKDLQEVGIKISLIQAFYVEMGGYVVVVPSEEAKDLNKPYKKRETIKPGLRCLTIPQVLWLSRNRLLIWPDQGTSSNSRTQNNNHDEAFSIPLYSSSPQISAVDDNKKPVQLLNTAEIEERSTANALVKFIVIIQTLWFILNCIFRTAHGLPLAQLEVLTLTYLVCSLSAYMIWWWKPHDIAISTVLDLSLNGEQWSKLGELMGDWDWSTMQGLGFSNVNVSNINLRFATIVLMATTCSSAMHFIAWNSYFPTTIELNIWRAAAVTLLVAPYPFVGSDWYTLPMGLQSVMDVLSIVLLVIAKLYILAESFAAFRSVPDTIYDTWEPSNYFFSFF